MKAAGKSIKALPDYAHGAPAHPIPFHRLKKKLTEKR